MTHCENSNRNLYLLGDRKLKLEFALERSKTSS